MSHFRLPRLLVLLLAGGIASEVWASNLLFLSDSVLSDMSQKNAESLRTTIHNALDEVKDREERDWQSEAGDIDVKIRPLVTYQQDNLQQQTCRQARFVIARNKRQQERYQFDFCRTAKGWNIAYTPASSFTKGDWTLLQQTLKNTLDNNNNGEPSSWTNHLSKNTGVLVPFSLEMRSGKHCRQTAITLFNKQGQASNGRYLFCRDLAGNWERLVE